MNSLGIFLAGFHEGMRSFGNNIASIVNSVLLFFVYFVGIGLTSIFSKISGKKFFQTNILKDEKTYWSDLNIKTKSLEEYYRQF